MNYILAFGGNVESDIGVPSTTIQAAFKELNSFGVRINQASGLYRTPCYPAGVGPDFVNAACSAEFEGTADELLAICHLVESKFGRVRADRWRQRPLDIDIIACGAAVLPDQETFFRWLGLDDADQQRTAPEQLILPHPRLQDRAFVLIPLAELGIDWVHPVLELTIAEMLDRLPDGDKQAIRPLAGPAQDN